MRCALVLGGARRAPRCVRPAFHRPQCAPSAPPVRTFEEPLQVRPLQRVAPHVLIAVVIVIVIIIFIV